MRWLLALVISGTFSQAQDLSSFLAAVQQHPAIIANQSVLQANRLRFEAVYFPVSLEVNGAYNRLWVDTSNALLPPGFDSSELENFLQFSAGLSFRPFVFGDISDLAAQRELDLRRAQLAFAETLSALEVQAIEAALRVQLAQKAVALAESAKALADSGLAVSQTRFALGAATEADLRASELRVLDAEYRLQSALANEELAEQGLRNLVGALTLDELPQLEPVTGLAPDVWRAMLDVELAQVGLRNSERALYPVAQLSYTVPVVTLDGEERKVNSEIALSLESRTLQPRLSYSYQNPKQSVAGFSAPPGTGLSLSDLEASLSIGLSLTISPDGVSGLWAAQAQLAAAEAGLQASIDSAVLTEHSLQNAIAEAQRSLRLARLELENARLNLLDSELRQASGLVTQLEVDQAAFALQQAELTVFSALLELQSSILATYRSYAIPVSEVLP